MDKETIISEEEQNRLDKLAEFDALAALYNKGEVIINDTVYSFAKMPFAVGLNVSLFGTEIGANYKAGDLSYLGSEKYKSLQKSMFNYVLIDGLQISKIANYFEDEDKKADYLPLVSSMLQIFSFPFVRGGRDRIN